MMPIAVLRRHVTSSAGGSSYGTHRYWRINISQNAGSTSFTAVSELQFHSTVGGSNIVGSGTPMSGGSGTDGTGNPASAAFDNSSATAWARSSATNTWIGYDFGTPVSVAEFVIIASPSPAGAWNQAPQSFTLDYSDNGTTWTTATGGTFTAYGWLDGQSRTYPEATVPAANHRFWRINVSSVSSGTLTAIQDLQFHATAGGADQSPACTNDNMGTSGRVIFSSENGGNEGYRAFDSSSTTCWAGNAAPQWLGFVFPSPVPVQEISLSTWTDTRWVPTAFTIDSSDDGSTWTQRATRSGLSLATGTTYTYSVP